MNVCMFRGNLTKDPEIKDFGGTKMASFRIAVNSFYRDKQTGELREISTFLDMECWNSKAELIGSLLKKGSAVTVQCSARSHSWESENGVKKSRIRFRVENFWVEGKKRRQNEAQEQEAKEPVPF